MPIAQFGQSENLPWFWNEQNDLNPDRVLKTPSTGGMFDVNWANRAERFNAIIDDTFSSRIEQPQSLGRSAKGASLESLSGTSLVGSSNHDPLTGATTNEPTTPPEIGQQVEYAPNQIVVKLKPEIASSEIDKIKQSLGVSADKTINKSTGAKLWKLNGVSVENAIGRSDRDPRFEYIEPNYRVSSNGTPTDQYFGDLWGLNNTQQAGGTTDADIDAPEAWNIQTGNSTVIGVIDTGVDYNHPDLDANIWTNPGEIAGDSIDNDGNGYVDDIHGYDFVNNDGDPMDDNGHGTHVSGTIAAEANNGIGVTGVNWSAKIMALKFLDANNSGYISNAIQALDYATTMGVKLTNNSWTSSGNSQALYDAISRANNAGALFVAAAGNGGSDYIGDNIDAVPVYPASYNLPNIISVAATDRYDNLASFSNYGATSVDLAAPGVSILSTFANNSYAYYEGTSMATPHVTGVASLILSQFPSLTPQQVKQQILNTIDPVASLSGKTLTGGRLNALRALSATPPPPPPPSSLSINDVKILEGNSGTTYATFTVNLDRTSTQTVSVNYATANSTATAGSDYTATSGTLSLLPGETSKTITVAVMGDTTTETDETFSIDLTNPINATLTDNQSVATISNDDVSDNAGNSLSKARLITPSTTTSTYSDWVGSTDSNDYYQFSLSQSRTLNLKLTGLSADANMQLIRDANNNRKIDAGEVLQTAANTGSLDESIARQLTAGTYFVRVYPALSSANTLYNLNLWLV